MFEAKASSERARITLLEHIDNISHEGLTCSILDTLGTPAELIANSI